MEHKLKTIGLIGGVSWESSKVYYQYINQMVQKELGGSHSAKIIMTSVDFAEIETLTVQHKWEQIGKMIALEAVKLEKAGADFIVVCSNLIHIAIPHIKNAVSLPLLHIANATGDAIKTKKIKKVALLGTRYTMEMDFYKDILVKDYALEVIIPEVQDRVLLNTIIYEQLVKGVFTDESKKLCLQLIKKMEVLGAEGVILGCTELPLLISDDEVEIPSFNTTKIHAKYAVDMAFSKSSLRSLQK